MNSKSSDELIFSYYHLDSPPPRRRRLVEPSVDLRDIKASIPIAAVAEAEVVKARERAKAAGASSSRGSSVVVNMQTVAEEAAAVARAKPRSGPRSFVRSFVSFFNLVSRLFIQTITKQPPPSLPRDNKPPQIRTSYIACRAN